MGTDDHEGAGEDGALWFLPHGSLGEIVNQLVWVEAQALYFFKS